MTARPQRLPRPRRGPSGLSLVYWLLVVLLYIPLVILFVISSSRIHAVIAAAIFVLASLTDWLDGRIARRRNQVTTLGTVLDPIADKLLVAAALISLLQIGKVEAWMVVVIVGRELAVTGLRAVAAGGMWKPREEDTGDERAPETVKERRNREQRARWRHEQLDARLRIKLERLLGPTARTMYEDALRATIG